MAQIKTKAKKTKAETPAKAKKKTKRRKRKSPMANEVIKCLKNLGAENVSPAQLAKVLCQDADKWNKDKVHRHLSALKKAGKIVHNKDRTYSLPKGRAKTKKTRVPEKSKKRKSKAAAKKPAATRKYTQAIRELNASKKPAAHKNISKAVKGIKKKLAATMAKIEKLRAKREKLNKEIEALTISYQEYKGLHDLLSNLKDMGPKQLEQIKRTVFAS